MNLGQRIRSRRKDARLTLRELANKIGMSKTWVADLENGRHLPIDEGMMKMIAWSLCDDWVALLEMAKAERFSRSAREAPRAIIVPPRSFLALETMAHDAVLAMHPIESREGYAIPVLETLAMLEADPSIIGAVRSAEHPWIETRTPEAQVSIQSGRFELTLREDVAERCRRGHPRARLTLMLAIAHIAIHGPLMVAEPAVEFAEVFSTVATSLRPKSYNDPRWQATTYALAFMMSLFGFIHYAMHKRPDDFSIDSMARDFGIPAQPATRRFETMQTRMPGSAQRQAV